MGHASIRSADVFIHNVEVAAVFNQIADLLGSKGDNSFPHPRLSQRRQNTEFDGGQRADAGEGDSFGYVAQ